MSFLPRYPDQYVADEVDNVYTLSCESCNKRMEVYAHTRERAIKYIQDKHGWYGGVREMCFDCGTELNYSGL